MSAGWSIPAGSIRRRRPTQCGQRAWNMLAALIDEFLVAPKEETLLLHIFGYSYELTNPDARHNWEYFEKLLERLAGRRDVEYMTNGEAVQALENRRKG